ncbi:hypothetical protein VPHD239_0173 [Vibrio phage D239]
MKSNYGKTWYVVRPVLWGLLFKVVKCTGRSNGYVDFTEQITMSLHTSYAGAFKTKIAYAVTK